MDEPTVAIFTGELKDIFIDGLYCMLYKTVFELLLLMVTPVSEKLSVTVGGIGLLSPDFLQPRNNVALNKKNSTDL